MRKLASIQEVISIQPIKDADRIELVTVQGWNVIVKKDEFKIGDKVIYVEIDSVLPEKPEFEFLRSKKFKIKTQKLRGVYSQGICFPLSYLKKDSDKYKVGDDVTSELGVYKFDPEGEEEKLQVNPKNFLMKYSWFRKLVLKKKNKDAFPPWFPKTDETRIQNLLSIFEQQWKNTSGWSVSYKLDGQSGSYFTKTVPVKKWFFFPSKEKIFGVCSRNIWLKTKHSCNHWDVALKFDIENILRRVPHDILIQGEILGPKIQKNIHKVSSLDFYVFNVTNLETGEKFSNKEVARFCKAMGLKHVPYVTHDFTLPNSINEIVEYSTGKDILNTLTYREGFVFRKDNHSFKCINPEYLVKNDL